MTSLSIVESSNNSNPFESIRRIDENGEYWSGRDLMPLLGYIRWDRVPDVIERAQAACENSGNSVSEHFSEEARKSIGRTGQDFRLSRYACYLVAMNGDPRKPEIASAQSYFAVKTRQAEILEAKQPEPVQVKSLPSAEERAEKVINVAERFEKLFGKMNPTMAQNVKDYAGNLFAESNQNLLTGSTEKWQGVVSVAEEMGYKVPTKGTHSRVTLGAWIRAFAPQLSDKQDKRLCNETQQEIWVYPLHNHEVELEMKRQIHLFFAHPEPSQNLKAIGWYKRK